MHSQSQILHPTHQNKAPAPFKFHKQQNLDERRFCKSFVAHLKTSKSARFETNQGESIHKHLKACQKVFLQAQNQLSKLNFILDTAKSLENKLFLPTIQRHSFSLSSLQLELSGNLDSDSILSKGLTSLKNINHLDLLLFSMTLDDLEIFKNLMKTLRKLRKMSSLSLIFYSCYGQTPLHYNTVFSNLTKMDQLRRLYLGFDNSEDLDTQDIDIFVAALPKLSFLTQIGLAFDGTWTFREPTLLQFFKAFQSMKNLTDLALNLRGCRFAYYYYETGSILESLKCLIGTSIKKFHLGLFQNFDSSNLQELSATLKELNFLQSFSLDFFSRSSLHDERFVDFGLALASLVSLSSLSISFPYGITSQNVVQTIASALMSLQNLVSLKLEFRVNNGTEDQQFQTLFANLKSLRSLKYLDIQLTDQKAITDNSLEVLGESLKQLNLLKNLSLGFSAIPLITNTGFQALCSGIQEGLPNLFSLSLKFYMNENINEKAMSILAEVLQSLHLLYSVELDFLGYAKIAGCQDLFNALRGMKNLEEIQLSLPKTEENSREICELEKIKNVQRFNLF